MQNFHNKNGPTNLCHHHGKSSQENSANTEFQTTTSIRYPQENRFRMMAVTVQNRIRRISIHLHTNAIHVKIQNWKFTIKIWKFHLEETQNNLRYESYSLIGVVFVSVSAYARVAILVGYVLFNCFHILR